MDFVAFPHTMPLAHVILLFDVSIPFHPLYVNAVFGVYPWVQREIYAEPPKFLLVFRVHIYYICKTNHRKRRASAPKSSPRSPPCRLRCRVPSPPTGTCARTEPPPSTTTSSTRTRARTTRSRSRRTRSPGSRPPSPQAGSSGISSSSFHSRTRTRSPRPTPVTKNSRTSS